MLHEEKEKRMHIEGIDVCSGKTFRYTILPPWIYSGLILGARRFQPQYDEKCVTNSRPHQTLEDGFNRNQRSRVHSMIKYVVHVPEALEFGPNSDAGRFLTAKDGTESGAGGVLLDARASSLWSSLLLPSTIPSSLKS